MNTESAQHTSFHIFVTKGNEHLKLEFDTATATGLEIKKKAGGSEADGLYHKVNGKTEEVRDEEVIELKNGLQFTLVPNGVVS